MFVLETCGQNLSAHRLLLGKRGAYLQSVLIFLMVFTFYFADYIEPSNINIYSRLGIYRLLLFTIHCLSVKFSWSSDYSEP